jgi:trehalose synthase-fused probable maltokinase
MAPMAPTEAHRTPGATSLDARWLAGRRWFRSKTRSISAVAPHDMASLGDGHWLLVLRVAFADGGEERYLVPAVESGGELGAPEDGQGTWRAILRRMLEGSRLDARQGSFQASTTAAVADLLPEGAGRDAGAAPATLPEVTFAGEQSNTSVRLGDRLVLKVYRRLEDGLSPEVEVNAFLTSVGFPHAPALAGSMSYRDADGTESSAAMLQELVAARGDGWSWLASRLGTPPDGPVEALAGASLIGGITAGMHQALASRPDRPDFPAREATATELAAWQAAAERQLAGALDALAGPERERLLARADVIRQRFGAIGGATKARVMRIHGDYHLGQLLRTESGFVVIDFEGEPARPLVERRAPASPLRDVAGMLRSFDYAAQTARRDGPPGLDLDTWLPNARRAFLTAYHDDALDGRLLAAFELEKACYEVAYEANNRPDWTWLPLEAIGRLVDGEP